MALCSRKGDWHNIGAGTGAAENHAGEQWAHVSGLRALHDCNQAVPLLVVAEKCWQHSARSASPHLLYFLLLVAQVPPCPQSRGQRLLSHDFAAAH